jgi:RepB DNA-primase from phage plasmid
MQLYALHDYNDNLKKRGAFEITKEERYKYNAMGYGIFIAPNEFCGGRKIANLEKISFWLADIDEGTKEEQLAKIKDLPIKPTIIIETKKGYHCWWGAVDATLENYKEVEKGLIKRLNADKACTDVSRILRCPGTWHKKDPQNPYFVQMIENNRRAYTEEKMLCAYQLPKPKLKPIKFNGEKKDFLDETKWERIFKLSKISEGNRNSTMARYTFWLKDSNMPNNEIIYIINGLNQKLAKPLSQEEIDQLLKTKGIY